MHFVLSLFCDGRVVEIFILRLVHLESGIFMVMHVFFLFRLGLVNHCRNGLSFFLILLMKSFLSAYVCRRDFVKSRPVGVVEFGVMNSCRDVLVVIPWGSGPRIDVGFLLKFLDGERGL